MAAEKTININKSKINKLIEFFNAVRIIYDAKGLINSGKYYHIATIYGQLRALLTDKTKERNKELKPLFDIASLLSKELDIYYMPNTMEKDLPFIQEGMLLHIHSLPISLEKQLPNQVQIHLEDYLETNIITYKGKNYKTSEIINSLSDKFGGSHYDTKVPRDLVELASISIYNQTILDNLVIQIAELFIKIGISLVKQVSDFEFYLIFQPKYFTSEENYFFDYTLPNSQKSRIALYCFQGKLRLHLCDLVGRAVNLEVERLLDIEEPIVLNISHRINHDLRSEIKIGWNGISVLEQQLPEPLLMLNEIHSYQGYFNRSLEREYQEFEFGLSELIVRGIVDDDVKRIEILRYLFNKKREGAVYYNKNSYGHSAPNQRDIKMVGNVLLKKNGA